MEQDNPSPSPLRGAPPSPAMRRERANAQRRSTKRSRQLRRDQTEAEKVIWSHLRARQLGFKFKRQFPVGPYFADFACVELKMIVEIDGGQHCENTKDAIRTKFLEEKGYKVIRFWNNDVMENMEGLLSALSLTLSRHSPREGTTEQQLS